jgi:hypothetical protein
MAHAVSALMIVADDLIKPFTAMLIAAFFQSITG